MTTLAMMGIKKPITLPFVRLSPGYSGGYSLEELTGISTESSEWFLAPVNSFIPPNFPVIVWSIAELSGVRCRVETSDLPLYNASPVDVNDEFELLFVEKHSFDQCQYFPTPEPDFEYPVLVRCHHGGNVLLSPRPGGWVLLHLQDDSSYHAVDSWVVSHRGMLDFLIREAESWETLVAEAGFIKPVPKGVLKW